MGNLRDEIKKIGLVPDQRINHWKRGVPQNPNTWAYKVYHFHLNNPPCTMADICRGIGASTKHTQKVTNIINQLRKAKTWTWPNRADREQAAQDQLEKVAGRHGEDV